MMEIIVIEDVMKTYGFSRSYATRLLHTKGCPVLPRKKGQKYRIVKDVFEIWLTNQYLK